MILCFARKFPCQCQPELSCEVKEVSAQNTFICGIRQDMRTLGTLLTMLNNSDARFSRKCPWAVDLGNMVMR